MIDFGIRLLEFIQEEFQHPHYELHIYYKCKNKKALT